jgi:hypothetical protein
MDGPTGRLVLGIGLNKTGTTSLHRALEILGYRGLHWGGPKTRALVRRAMEEGNPMLSYLAPEIETITDLEEVTYNFDLAAEQYPQARFILTIRDLDDWVDSRRRHVQRNREAKAAGTYHGPFLDIDEPAWRADYQAHEKRVREHFSERSDRLLVFDVSAGEGWTPLCDFLGHEQPDAEFPWANRHPPSPAPQVGQSGV